MIVVAFYRLQATGYFVNPVGYDAFESFFRSIEEFRPTGISLPLPRRAV